MQNSIFEGNLYKTAYSDQGTDFMNLAVFKEDSKPCYKFFQLRTNFKRALYKRTSKNKDKKRGE